MPTGVYIRTKYHRDKMKVPHKGSGSGVGSKKTQFKKGHIGYKVWLGKSFSKNHRNKISLSKIGKPSGKKGKKCSEESKIKISLSKIGHRYYKRKSPKPFTDEHKRKIREANMRNLNKIFKDTKIELKIEKELQKRNINYQKQVPLCKIARVDFYLPEYRIVIQCDGCFWHGCPIHNPKWIKNKERDKNQNKILIENGYKVYRFWEHSINRKVENCINKLEK